MSRYSTADLQQMPMKNQVSMLEGLNLTDAEAVRRFMRGLEYHLTHVVLNTNFDDMLGLSHYELAKIGTILACIRRNGLSYPLLAEATLRFISQRHREPKYVLAAAWDFDEFASEAALTIPDMYPYEYGLAEQRMIELRGPIDVFRIAHNLHDLIPGAFGRQVYHVGRSVELETMAAEYGGDIRDIPRDVQLAPHAIPSGDSAVNPDPCYHCTRDNKYCDRVEPKCTCCRERWHPCTYDNPVLKKEDEKNKKNEKATEKPTVGSEKDERIQFDGDIDYDDFESIENFEGEEGAEDVEGIEEDEIIEEDDNESIASSILFGLTMGQTKALANGPTTKLRENIGAGAGTIAKDSAANAIEKPTTEQLATPRPKLKLILSNKSAVEKTTEDKATAQKAVVKKGNTKKVTFDEKATTKKVPTKSVTIKGTSSMIATAEKVAIDKAKTEKPATTDLGPPKVKPLKIEYKPVSTSKSATVVTKISPPKKTPPPPSDRVTRRMTRSNLSNTGDIYPEPFPSVMIEASSASVAVVSKPQGTKRKQQAINDFIDETTQPANQRPAKRAKQPVMNDASLSIKRSSVDAGLDDNTTLHPNKKTKPGSNTKPSSGTKNEGEGGKRIKKGRPEQDHEGKKCCNTCQGWKPLSDFALKKHSSTPGATVGYCRRCQSNKQAKNKAKADAKRSVSQTNTVASEMMYDDENADADGYINYENRENNLNAGTGI